MNSNLSSAQAFDLSGRTALITGGRHGLGIGYGPVLGGRQEPKSCWSVGRTPPLDAAAKSLGPGAFALTSDVSKAKQAAEIIFRAEQMAGPLSILINNAGVHEA